MVRFNLESLESGKVLNFYRLGCKVPKDSIYIGRPNYKWGLKGSKFQNPYSLEKYSREVAIAKYKTWLWNEIKIGHITIQELANMKGRDLVCYCNPKGCHGDVLLKAIEWADSQI